MARGKKDDMYLNGMSKSKNHGDLGYIGEMVKKERDMPYEGGCVDEYLTSDYVPSFVETVKCASRNHKAEGIYPGDMPRGKMAIQEGPEFKKADMAEKSGMGRRPGKVRKGEY